MEYDNFIVETTVRNEMINSMILKFNKGIKFIPSDSKNEIIE